LRVACAGNVFGEKAAVGGRGSGVVCSGDDQRLRTDLGEVRAEVKVANRRATPNVSLWIQRFKNTYGGFDFSRRRRLEEGRKPSSCNCSRDFLHSSRFDGLNACVPEFIRADLRRSIAENEFVKAFGSMEGERHADHAADGESAKMKAA